MTVLSVAAAGTFTLGGDLVVNRLGFGAMRITGKGIWGEPEDRDEALRVLRRLPELGIDFIDTADAYGPEVSENLIREALHPYKGIVVATKGANTRHGPDIWAPVGRPEYLRQCVLLSMRRLGVERIDLWQLHRIDRKVRTRGAVPGHCRHAARRAHPPRRAERGQRRGDPGGAAVLPGGERAEPLQPHHAPERGSIELLRTRADRLHPLVPAGGRRPGTRTARCWTRSRRSWAPPRRRWRWPGCSSAARSCCRSPARARSLTWTRMRPLPNSH